MNMRFITANTATAESIEDAIDKAFEIAIPNLGKGSDVRSVATEIATELDNFLAYREMSRPHFRTSLSKTAVYARRAFILDMLALGYSMADISRGTQIPYQTVAGIKRGRVK